MTLWAVVAALTALGTSGAGAQDTGGGGAAVAGPWVGQQDFTPATVVAGDQFGGHTAIDGETIITTARVDDVAAANAGSAYVYTRNGTGWSLQQQLFASDAGPSGFFGNDAAISGDTAVVTSTFGNNGAGSAYVFVRNGTVWTEQQILTASDAPAGGQSSSFGQAVAIDGDTIVVSDTSKLHAYVFVRSDATWTEQAMLTPVGGVGGDAIGRDVDIDGDTAVVGATGDDTGVANGGAAHVFTRSGTTWTPQQELVPAGLEVDSFVGNEVELSGDTIMIANTENDTVASNAGAIRVFTRSGTTWTEQSMLTAADGQADDRLGTSLSLDGGVVVSRSRTDEGAADSPGSVYVFTRSGTTWSQAQRIRPSDPYDFMSFGNSVGVSGTTIAVATTVSGGIAGEMGVFVPATCENLDDYATAGDLGAVGEEVVTITGDTNCATGEAGETADGAVETVWFEFTAEQTGSMTASTCLAASFDTFVGVYTVAASVGAATLLGSDNDPNQPDEDRCSVTSLRAQVTVPVTSGTAYRVQIDGAGATNGTFTLSLQQHFCGGVAATQVGSPGDDFFDDTPDGAVVVTSDGDDQVIGATGATLTVCLGAGDDTVRTSSGDDVVSGGPGSDDIRTFGGADIVVGYAEPDDPTAEDPTDGNDTIRSGNGPDETWANGGDDTVIASGGADQVFGGGGLDSLNGGAGPDEVHGGEGDDVVRGQGDVDQEFGDAGDDIMRGHAGDDVMHGGDGEDTLLSSTGDDELFGGPNDDTLFAGTGADTLDGGAHDIEDFCHGGTDTDVDTDINCERRVKLP